MTQRLAIASIAVVSLVLSTSSAHAQWTLPRGTVVVTTGADVGWANTEFFGFGSDPGEERRFPLRGEYVGASARLGIRAGFTDELELDFNLPLSVVSYQSDPVLLLPQEAGSMEDSLDYYQRNVIQLSRTAFGIADFSLAARYRWLVSPFAMATELRLKAPTGYRGPAGTFGEDPRSVNDFLADVGRFVNPENVTDDVTLGDGQLDVSLRMIFGFAFPTRTFIRVDAGYNLRLGDAGDQFVASLRAGQLIAGFLLVFAGVGLHYTVEPGRVIGVSVAAKDPNLPAAEYGGTTNLLLREVRLQRDVLDVGGGIILRLTPEAELGMGVSRIVWGRNTAAVTSVFLQLAVRTSLLEPEAPEVPEPEPVREGDADDASEAVDEAAPTPDETDVVALEPQGEPAEAPLAGPPASGEPEPAPE